MNVPQKPRQVATCLTILLWLLARPLSGAEVQTVRDKQTVLRWLDKVQNLDVGPESGSGNGVVEVERPYKSWKHFVHFDFSEDMSRGDVFQWTKGDKPGARTRTYAQSDRGVIVVWFDRPIPFAAIQRKSNTFRDNPELNFHPRSFTVIDGSPINFKGIKENIRNDRGTYAVTVLKSKVVRFEYRHRFEEEKQYGTLEFEIDTNDGNRLISWNNEFGNVYGPGQLFSKKLRIKWRKYDGHWYVDRLDFEGRFRDGRSPEDTKRDPPPLQVRRLRVNVLDFVPKVKLKAQHFHLNGLGLPDGTHVEDRINNVSYKWRN